MAHTIKIATLDLKDLLRRLKVKILSSAEMYHFLGLDEKIAFQAFRSEGLRGKYNFPECLWSEDNPTSGYCYRITGSVFVRLVDENHNFEKDKKLVVMKLDKEINGKPPYYHYFLLVYDNNKKDDSVLLDLTRDQIDKDNIHKTIQEYPYEEAIEAHATTIRNIRNAKEQKEFRTLFWEKYDRLLLGQ